MPDYIYNQVAKAMQEEFDRALNQSISSAPGSYGWGLGLSPNYGSVMPDGSYQLPGGRWIIPAEGGGTQSQPQEPRLIRNFDRTNQLLTAYRGGWNPSPALFNELGAANPGFWQEQKNRQAQSYADRVRNPNLYLFPQGGAFGNTGQASPGPYGFMGQPPGVGMPTGAPTGVSGGGFAMPGAAPQTPTAPATPGESQMFPYKRPAPSGYARRFYRG